LDDSDIIFEGHFWQSIYVAWLKPVGACIGCVLGWLDSCLDGCIDGCIDSCIDGWLDGLDVGC
jgi:hypothetical protein